MPQAEQQAITRRDTIGRVLAARWLEAILPPGTASQSRHFRVAIRA